MAAESLDMLLSKRRDIIINHTRCCFYARLTLYKFVDAEDAPIETLRHLWSRVIAHLCAAKMQESLLLDLDNRIATFATLADPLGFVIARKFSSWPKSLGKAIAMIARRLARTEDEICKQSRIDLGDATKELRQLMDEAHWLRFVKANAEVLMCEVMAGLALK